MNEDLIEKIALFIERQCPRKMFVGMKCTEYSCSVHWTAAQIRNRKFEEPLNEPSIKARYSNLTPEAVIQ